MYVRPRARVDAKRARRKKYARKKIFEKSRENIWQSGLDVVTLHPEQTYKLKTYNYGNQESNPR